jgi:hypothetical protein
MKKDQGCSLFIDIVCRKLFLTLKIGKAVEKVVYKEQ